VVAGLACFDMDGTLIDAETLDTIAREIGAEEKVRKITGLAMTGQMDFYEAVRLRLKLLKGVTLETIERIADGLPLMPGAEELVARLKERGFVTGIITGGFDIVAERVAKRLGMDFWIANKLVFERGHMTGGFELEVNGNKDVLMRGLRERLNAELTLAVGDGVNDIPLLRAADIGIAFCAKQAVNEQVRLQVGEKDLTRILDIIGDKGLNIVVDRTVHEIAGKSLGLIGNVKVVDTKNMGAELINGAEVLVIRTNLKVDRGFIDAANNLKIIATATTGTDHIDIGYAREKGIAVLDAKGENADAVADYVFRMLLNVLDDVYYTNWLLKKTGRFREIKEDNLRHELRYLRLGIIGYGNVGRRVEKRAKAFGMEVKAYDPYVAEARDTLEEVMGCDIVTLHPELTEETRYMIDEAELRLMKKDAVLINAARGKIVREAALKQALKEGRIKCAILDVFENEPDYTELYELDNTIVTPHIAGNTVEARMNAAKRMFVEVATAVRLMKEVLAE
jgi:phosphoserine phosphatase SerB